MGRNSYFQFKQFIIRQDNAAMKVSTDSVLLGAWVSVDNSNTLLDIGTGTGVISLMIAQRCDGRILAIDKEVTACRDARMNAGLSPWKDRIEVLEMSLQEYLEYGSLSFDCIVCNPPYFSNSIKSNDVKRMMARHNDELPFEVLIAGVSKILTREGRFSVILPSSSEGEFRMIAANHRLFPSKISRVKTKPSAAFSRVLMEFRFEGVLGVENELIIETEIHHEYQNDFIALVKDYYLNY